jgi:hypothetical protein
MHAFVLRFAAQLLVASNEMVKLTQRDSRLVMEVLDHPPSPNAKLRKAARALLRGERMDKDFKRMTDFLVGMRVEQVPHTHKSYLAHLIAVHRDLETRGCSQDACRAGMFHSIYGTERFQGFKLSLERRAEVRQLIGDRAERLAYLNCAMERASLDKALEQATGPYHIIDRITGKEVELSSEDFDDLSRVHLYDWLEQVPRSKEWDYRRPAYRRMAERLGPKAQEAYAAVFAQEGALA